MLYQLSYLPGYGSTYARIEQKAGSGQGIQIALESPSRYAAGPSQRIALHAGVGMQEIQKLDQALGTRHEDLRVVANTAPPKPIANFARCCQAEPLANALNTGKRSAVSYQPSAQEGAVHRIRATNCRLPSEADC